MIFYNAWLNNDAHSKAFQTQHNESHAAAYFEALRPLRVALDAVLSPLRRAWQTWHRRQLRRASVRELSALDDRMLKDIGLSRSQIPAMAFKAGDNAQPAKIERLATVQPGFKPAQPATARSATAESATADSECQVIPLVQPARAREIQHTPNGRRHRYPLPLNAA